MVNQLFRLGHGFNVANCKRLPGRVFAMHSTDFWGAGIHQSPAWVVVDGCLMLFVIELPPVKPQFGKDKLVKITMINRS